LGRQVLEGSGYEQESFEKLQIVVVQRG
jgi:hypothetical protein